MSRILARVLGDPGGPAPVRPRLPMMFEPGLDLMPGPAMVTPPSESHSDGDAPRGGDPGTGHSGTSHPGADHSGTGQPGTGHWGADEPERRGDAPGTGADASGAATADTPAGQAARPAMSSGPARTAVPHPQPEARRGRRDPARSPRAAADPAGIWPDGDGDGPVAEADAVAEPGRPARRHQGRRAAPQIPGEQAGGSPSGGLDIAGPALVPRSEVAAGQPASVPLARQYQPPDPATIVPARERRVAGVAVEPVVRISIGRVEIRADRTDPPGPVGAVARPRRPGVELSEYLRRRSGQR